MKQVLKGKDWTDFRLRLPDDHKLVMHGKSPALNPDLRAGHIMLVNKLVKEDDCELLVNLWWACKQSLGLDWGYSMRQMAEGMFDEWGTYQRMPDLIDCLRRDLRHWSEELAPHCRMHGLRLRRILPSVGVVPGSMRERSDDRSINTTKWVVFLHKEYEGGRFYFPTRRVAIQPRRGTVIRWPGAMPWGLEPITGADPQFLLTGQTTTYEDGPAQEEWPDQMKYLL